MIDCRRRLAKVLLLPFGRSRWRSAFRIVVLLHHQPMPSKAKEDPKSGHAAAFPKAKQQKIFFFLLPLLESDLFETVEYVCTVMPTALAHDTIKSDRYSEIFAKGEVIKNIRLGGHPMIHVSEYYGQWLLSNPNYGDLMAVPDWQLWQSAIPRSFNFQDDALQTLNHSSSATYRNTQSALSFQTDTIYCYQLLLLAPLSSLPLE